MDEAGGRASSAPAQGAHAPTTKGRDRCAGRARPVSRPRPRAGSTSGLERLLQPLETAAPEADHLEAQIQRRKLGVGREPRLGSLAQAALLLLRDHLERIAVSVAALRLHLDERELPSAAHDEIELVPADPDVRLQDAVTAQPVVPPRAALGRTPGLTRSRGLGTSGGGSQRARSPARPRSGAA